MSNKVASINSSKLLDNKLAVILEELNTELKDSDIAEKELILAKFNGVINKFYNTLSNPLFKLETFKKGTFPNYKYLNLKFKDIENDLKILYREINSLELFLVSNYNTLNTEASSLRGRLRRIASNLGDFRLHATDNLGGATYFTDSFHNTDKIDYDNKLYNEQPCSIDIQTGIVSLPVNTSKTKKYMTEEISIGNGSNGIAGNNQQLNALLRGELKTISDSNPDSWFEYENVTDEPSITPLIFELKLKLDKDSIINTLSISPTAFATRNYPRITKLEVSIDGKEYTDIISQVPSSAFFEDTRDKVIILNPASGKFSGISKIKIPPIKVRYINIIFQQDDSYIIKTPSGIKYRKAIGLRDIDIMGEVYEAKGELGSILFTPQDEIKKVSVIANSQTAEGLTGIKHYLSVDDGQNWNEIQSVEKIGTDIEEILNYNLEGIESIKTSTPAISIRHKAFLERTATGFSARGGVERRRESKSDFRTIGAGTQSVTLSQSPIASTVNVRNVSFGSVGRDQFYLVNTKDIIERNGNKIVYLPQIPFTQNSTDIGQEIIRIDNEIWTKTSDLSSENDEAKVYEFDYLNNIIKFGDDTNGKKPSSDILFGLEAEQVVITQDSPRKVRLKLDIDGVKETTSLYRLKPAEQKANHILPKAAAIHRLNLTNIQTITIINDDASALIAEKIFSNGSSELSIAGDYSVNYKEGVIYTYAETAEETDTIIDISYLPKEIISDFKITDSELEINEEDYITESENELIIIAGATKTIRLTNGFVEPRSIRFLSLSDSFKTEVPFKGDGTEFNLGLPASELDGYYTIDYKKGIIYTYSNISGSLVLEYNKTLYYAEYNIAVKISGENYSVDEENSTITFTNEYIVRAFSESLNKSLLRTLFKVDYEYVVELEQNPKELEPYYSPLLKDYALAILTKGQL